jgi:sulfite exporter TauE/SafE
MAFRLQALERLLLSDESPLAAFYKQMQRRLGCWMGRSAGVAPLMAGVLNGLLPCGLVYGALAGAVGTDSLGQSVVYMLLFGAGTVPMMFSISVLGVRWRWSSAYYRLFPVFLSVLAVLLLMRGFSFQLPDDFFFQEKLKEVPMCH